MPRYHNTPERFWNRVDRSGACWLWTGSVSSSGYGHLTYQTKHIDAHVLAYTLTHGTPPEGLFVCHTCDNKRCCNPAHLFLATHQGNMDDMRAKGRSRVGERHRSAKLTTEQVITMRERVCAGEPTGTIAAEYNVSWFTVNRIVRHKEWQHIGGPKLTTRRGKPIASPGPPPNNDLGSI